MIVATKVVEGLHCFCRSGLSSCKNGHGRNKVNISTVVDGSWPTGPVNVLGVTERFTEGENSGRLNTGKDTFAGSARVFKEEASMLLVAGGSAFYAFNSLFSTESRA